MLTYHETKTVTTRTTATSVTISTKVVLLVLVPEFSSKKETKCVYDFKLFEGITSMTSAYLY